MSMEAAIAPELGEVARGGRRAIQPLAWPQARGVDILCYPGCQCFQTAIKSTVFAVGSIEQSRNIALDP